MQKKYEYKVVNIVYAGRVIVDKDASIDLLEIASKNASVSYNPERFPGLIVKFDDPKGTVLLFSGGNVVLTGIKEDRYKTVILKKFFDILSDVGIRVSGYDVEPKNIVAAGYIIGDNGYSLNLDLNMVSVLIDNTMYEPEMFPGLVYRVVTDKFTATFLIFANGKIVCVGLRKFDYIDEAFEIMRKSLKDADLLSETIGKVTDEEEFVFL